MYTEFNMILPLTDADDFLFKDPNSIIPLYFINQYMYECVMALENSNNDTKVLRYPSIVENMLLNVYTWLYDGLYNDEEEDVEREREIENLIIPYSLLESIHYLFTFPYFSSKFKEMVLIDEHQIVQITPSSTKGFVKMTFVICGIYGNN